MASETSEIRRRLTHKPPAHAAIGLRLDRIREAIIAGGERAESDAVTNTREWSLALTHLEEACYWAIASVVRSDANT